MFVCGGRWADGHAVGELVLSAVADRSLPIGKLTITSVESMLASNFSYIYTLGWGQGNVLFLKRHMHSLRWNC